MIDKKSKQPMCHLCEFCLYEKKIKGHICTLLNNKNVTQSHFGKNSPRLCPKRSES